MKKFTLIELITGIVVISILALIVMLSLEDFRVQATETRDTANLREVQFSVDRYFLDKGKYPVLNHQPSKSKKSLINLDLLITEYLKKNTLKKKYSVDFNGVVYERSNEIREVNSYVIYYGEKKAFILDELKNYDLVILNPDTWSKSDIQELRTAGVKTLAYIPFSEIHQTDTVFLDKMLESDYKLNPDGSKMKEEKAFVMDVITENYKEAFFNEATRRMHEDEFDGLFIDTVDNIEADYLYSQSNFNELLESYKSLLIKLRLANPDLFILQNRGFKVLSSLEQENFDYAAHIDGVLWENFRYTDFGNVPSHYKEVVNMSQRMIDEDVIFFSVGNKYELSDLEKINAYAEELNYIHYNQSLGYDYDYLEPRDKYTQEETYEEKSISNHINLGDTFQIGEFNGHPLHWNVIKNTEEGLLLFSDQLLKKESGSYLRQSFDLSKESFESDNDANYRLNNGSNAWKHSDLRSWLNSTFIDETFSGNEKSFIIEGKRKVLLTDLDVRERTMGSEGHLKSRNYDDLRLNYDNAYSYTVKDKVFLLSIEEFATAYEVLGLPKVISERHYFLRDSQYDEPFVYYVAKEGTRVSTTAPMYDEGIRPAIYIKLDDFDGDGTAENPYKVK